MFRESVMKNGEYLLTAKSEIIFSLGIANVDIYIRKTTVYEEIVP